MHRKNVEERLWILPKKGTKQKENQQTPIDLQNKKQNTRILAHIKQTKNF
jgi:hypothetical protein